MHKEICKLSFFPALTVQRAAGGYLCRNKRTELRLSRFLQKYVPMICLSLLCVCSVISLGGCSVSVEAKNISADKSCQGAKSDRLHRYFFDFGLLQTDRAALHDCSVLLFFLPSQVVQKFHRKFEDFMLNFGPVAHRNIYRFRMRLLFLLLGKRHHALPGSGQSDV